MLDRGNIKKSEMINVSKFLVLISCLSVTYYCYFNYNYIVVHITDPKFSLNGPHNTKYLPADVYNQLIDIKNFTFKVNPQPCQGYEAGLLLIIIISSKPTNYERRSIIRNTWGQTTDSTKVIFLMGETTDPVVTRAIINESQTYGDIVQGTFTDVYHNMTYKHVMGLKWVSHHCSMAKYVLKADDDIMVNSYALRQFLVRELSPWGAKGLIACSHLQHAPVLRESKWKVTKEEFSESYYPKYCSGWAILYSQDVVSRLLSAAQFTPFFWVDDAYVTGILAGNIGVERTHLYSLILDSKRANTLTSWGPKYSGKFIFGLFNLDTKEMWDLWKAIDK